MIQRAYEHNLGEIQLNIIDNRVEIYTEKGYLRKSKKLIKTVYIQQIKEIYRNNNELIIKTINGEDIKIRFYESDSIQKIYNNLIDIKSRLEQSQNKKNKVNIKEMFMNTLIIINLIFDILICLDAKIVWRNLEENLNAIKEFYKKIKLNYNKFVELDFSQIEKHIVDRDPEQISLDLYEILREIFLFYGELDKIEEDDLNILRLFRSSSSDLNILFELAVLLNDIILGIILKDGDINFEIDVFLNETNSTSKNWNIIFETDYIVKLFEELKIKGKDDKIKMKIRDCLKDFVDRCLSRSEQRVSTL
jgi:hypothetical protein